MLGAIRDIKNYILSIEEANDNVFETLSTTEDFHLASHQTKITDFSMKSLFTALLTYIQMYLYFILHILMNNVYIM